LGAPRVASCPARLVSRSPSAASLFAAGYWRKTNFLKEMAAEGKDKAGEIDFYDSVSGAKLFTAPRGRTFEEFVKESDAHGWPSFRDEEVNWDHVRVLEDGETVSTVGTHLGHNLPDRNGNRYCINLVSVAGREGK
jgi:peptide methionine sulfoxide reductase MsrB